MVHIMGYDYISGLGVLTFLRLDLTLDEIEKFKERFECYRSGLSEKGKVNIDKGNLIALTAGAYSDVKSQNDKILREQLYQSFIESYKNSKLFKEIGHNQN